MKYQVIETSAYNNHDKTILGEFKTEDEALTYKEAMENMQANTCYSFGLGYRLPYIEVKKKGAK